MPSGYTSDLYDGKDISFEQFVLRCARAFGPFIMQRDESLDVEPRLLEYNPDSYSERELVKNLAKLEFLLSMTEEEKSNGYLTYVAEKVEAQSKSEIRRAGIRARYETMLRKVLTWNVSGYSDEFLPNLKKFMIEQLEESIKFDGSSYVDRILESPQEWWENQVNTTKRYIEIEREQIQKDKERVESQNRMARDLFDSLGLDVPEEKIAYL